MVTEGNSDNTVSLNNYQMLGPEKVQVSQAAKPLQTLPEDGKPLPPAQEDPANEETLQAKKLDDVVQGLNERAQSLQRELQFSVDNDSGRIVIKVLDQQTEELIRQIPAEEALKFARMLKEGEQLELFSVVI